MWELYHLKGGHRLMPLHNIGFTQLPMIYARKSLFSPFAGDIIYNFDAIVIEIKLL